MLNHVIFMFVINAERRFQTSIKFCAWKSKKLAYTKLKEAVTSSAQVQDHDKHCDRLNNTYLFYITIV